MLFITLVRWRKKITKETLPPPETSKFFKLAEKEGVKPLAVYWTLGRYDAVGITEAKDEKTYMRLCLAVRDTDSIETLVAVPREEAVKLLE